jgi:hypothetical protein
MGAAPQPAQCVSVKELFALDLDGMLTWRRCCCCHAAPALLPGPRKPGEGTENEEQGILSVEQDKGKG